VGGKRRSEAEGVGGGDLGGAYVRGAARMGVGGKVGREPFLLT